MNHRVFRLFQRYSPLYPQERARHMPAIRGAAAGHARDPFRIRRVRSVGWAAPATAGGRLSIRRPRTLKARREVRAKIARIRPKFFYDAVTTVFGVASRVFDLSRNQARHQSFFTSHQWLIRGGQEIAGRQDWRSRKPARDAGSRDRGPANLDRADGRKRRPGEDFAKFSSRFHVRMTQIAHHRRSGGRARWSRPEVTVENHAPRPHRSRSYPTAAINRRAIDTVETR